MGESRAGWSDNRPSESWGSGKGAPDVELPRCAATRVWEGGKSPDARRLAWMFCCVVTALLQKEGVVGQTLSPEKKANYF